MPKRNHKPKPKTVLQQPGGANLIIKNAEWPVDIQAGDEVDFVMTETGFPRIKRIIRDGLQIWPAITSN